MDQDIPDFAQQVDSFDSNRTEAPVDAPQPQEQAAPQVEQSTADPVEPQAPQEQTQVEPQQAEAPQEPAAEAPPVEEVSNEEPIQQTEDTQQSDTQTVETEPDPITLNEEPEQVDAQGGQEFNETEQREIFGEHLAYHTQNKITSLEDIDRIIQENNQLKQNPPMQFANEKQKEAFELIKNFSDPIAMLSKYGEAIGADTSKMDERQKMFTAFKLDEQNADMSDAEALQVFDALYGEKFELMEDDVAVRYEIRQAARKAEQKITEIQSKMKEADSKDANASQSQAVSAEEPQTPSVDPELQRQINDSIARAVDETSVIPLKVNDNQFNYALKDPKDKTELQAAATNLVGWLSNEIGSYTKQDGSVDYNGYLGFVASLVFRDKISSGLFTSGMKQGEKKVVTELKNPAPQREVGTQEVVSDNRSYQDKVFDKMFESLNR